MTKNRCKKEKELVHIQRKAIDIERNNPDMPDLFYDEEDRKKIENMSQLEREKVLDERYQKYLVCGKS